MQGHAGWQRRGVAGGITLRWFWRAVGMRRTDPSTPTPVLPHPQSVAYVITDVHGLEEAVAMVAEAGAGPGGLNVSEGATLVTSGKCRCSVGCGFSTVAYFICWPICCASCYTKGTYDYQLCFGFDPNF